MLFRSSLVIDGREYRVKTDYRDWLRFTESGEAQDVFLDASPLFTDSAIEIVHEFFIGKPSNAKESERSGEPIIDYTIDAALIYASFMQAYGLDLIEVKHLHWHKFLALLNGLPKDTIMSQVVGYRLYEGKDKELIKLRERWKLPKRLSETEKETADYFESVWG